MENDQEDELCLKFEYDEDLARAREALEEDDDFSPDYDSTFYINSF